MNKSQKIPLKVLNNFYMHKSKEILKDYPDLPDDILTEIMKRELKIFIDNYVYKE